MEGFHSPTRNREFVEEPRGYSGECSEKENYVNKNVALKHLPMTCGMLWSPKEWNLVRNRPKPKVPHGGYFVTRQLSTTCTFGSRHKGRQHLETVSHWSKKATDPVQQQNSPQNFIKKQSDLRCCWCVGQILEWITRAKLFVQQLTSQDWWIWGIVPWMRTVSCWNTASVIQLCTRWSS